jgi:hypothetical protein
VIAATRTAAQHASQHPRAPAWLERLWRGRFCASV